MSISEEYKRLLETFNRTLGQARRYGVDHEYHPVKKPTKGSIKRLRKELERLKTQIWFKSLERKRKRDAIKKAQELIDLINASETEEQSSESNETLSDKDIYSDSELQGEDANLLVSESEIIISNFRNLVRSMGEADYQLKHISFGSKSSMDARQPGVDAREEPINDILNMLDDVIQYLGENEVAKNIKKSGETLERLIEELVFAIYRNRYSKYGGGRTAYNAAIQFEIKGILSGSY